MKKLATIVFLILLAALTLHVAAQKPVKQYNYCQATTKAGNPCKCYAMKGSKFCYHHQPKDSLVAKKTVYYCNSKTQKGTPCRNKVSEAGGKCHYHNR